MAHSHVRVALDSLAGNGHRPAPSRIMMWPQGVQESTSRTAKSKDEKKLRSSAQRAPTDTPMSIMCSKRQCAGGLQQAQWLL
eukprot:scaffold61053_cov17-Tisochrysis_lutea.AAC.1